MLALHVYLVLLQLQGLFTDQAKEDITVSLLIMRWQLAVFAKAAAAGRLPTLTQQLAGDLHAAA